MDALIKTDKLYDWSECKQPAKLIEWLKVNNIPFRLSRTGKPITTLAAINGSLQNLQHDEINF
jgi:hypothetical protein